MLSCDKNLGRSITQKLAIVPGESNALKPPTRIFSMWLKSHTLKLDLNIPPRFTTLVPTRAGCALAPLTSSNQTLLNVTTSAERNGGKFRCQMIRILREPHQKEPWKLESPKPLEPTLES